MISKRTRSYALVMILLTTAYLVIELSFNASLLDATGQATSTDEIDRIEVYGRCISATAVILALFGSMLKKRFLLQTTTTRLVISTVLMIAIVFPTVYGGERELIEFFVRHSNGEDRRDALWMVFISKSLLNGEIDLDGVDFSTGEKSSPADKAFISLLPLWGSTAEDITRKAEKVMPYIVRKNMESQTGSYSEFYNKAYLTSIKSLHELYNDKYVPGSNAYARAIADASRQADESWAQYLNKLSRRGYKPHTVPGFARSRVRRDVRSAGVPVPDNWQLNDRQGFNNAVVKRVKGEAKRSFDGQIRNLVSGKATLPAGLSWPGFIKAEVVQDLWRSKLGMPGKGLLTDQMSPATFKQSVYLPMIEGLTHRTLNLLHQSGPYFENKERYSREGEDAFRSAIVAPIALGFSMIGGFVHIVKLLNFTLLLGIPLSRVRKFAVMAALVVLVSYPTTIKTDITSSRLITNLTDQAKGQKLAKLRSGGLTWIIKTQTIFYPVNDLVRKNLLGGFDFKI